MTISISPISVKPLFSDEARRLTPSSSAVCHVEGSHSRSPNQSQDAAGVPIALESPPKGSIPAPSHLAFVYGTLKHGFGNHWLMQELIAGLHARFLGFAYTKRRFPLVCGPFQVPFLLPSPSPSGHHVRGELYQVDSIAISRLDDLEGVSKGHYERRPLSVLLSPSLQSTQPQSNEETDVDLDTCCTLAGPLTSCRLVMDPEVNSPDVDVDNTHVDLDKLSSSIPSSSPPFTEVLAEAYFACPSYGLHMADRAPHLQCYTEKEASTYVRRKDRPNGRTFLEHVHAWIEEKGLICN